MKVFFQCISLHLYPMIVSFYCYNFKILREIIMSEKDPSHHWMSDDIKFILNVAPQLEMILLLFILFFYFYNIYNILYFFLLSFTFRLSGYINDMVLCIYYQYIRTFLCMYISTQSHRPTMSHKHHWFFSNYNISFDELVRSFEIFLSTTFTESSSISSVKYRKELIHFLSSFW